MSTLRIRTPDGNEVELRESTNEQERPRIWSDGNGRIQTTLPAAATGGAALEGEPLRLSVELAVAGAWSWGVPGGVIAEVTPAHIDEARVTLRRRVEEEAASFGPLVMAVRDEIASRFRRLACINAVAALVDVAASDGVALRPLTVRARVFNPPLARRIGDLDEPEAAARLPSAMQAPDSFIVAVGTAAPNPGDWAGHLVALGDTSDPERKLILDATIEQANQPHHAIVLAPLAFVVPSSRVGGDAVSASVNGCGILYKTFPEERDYERFGAWRREEQRSDVCRAVRRRLGQGR